jgi:HAD superfamily hydrolase (TIGR01490 family)
MSEYNVAFFDVDETVVSFKTMFSFLEFYLDNSDRFKNYMNNVRQQWVEGVDRTVINKEYYEQYNNESVSSVRNAVQSWLVMKKKELGDNFFLEPTLKLIRSYQKRGVNVVFVSGSFMEIICPIADELLVKDIIATEIEEKQGIYTGKIIPPQTIGHGKVTAILNYLKKNNFSEKNAVAYGDHFSDFPMLAAVSSGFIISSDESVIAAAQNKGFGIIRT